MAGAGGAGASSKNERGLGGFWRETAAASEDAGEPPKRPSGFDSDAATINGAGPNPPGPCRARPVRVVASLEPRRWHSLTAITLHNLVALRNCSRLGDEWRSLEVYAGGAGSPVAGSGGYEIACATIRAVPRGALAVWPGTLPQPSWLIDDRPRAPRNLPGCRFKLLPSSRL